MFVDHLVAWFCVEMEQSIHASFRQMIFIS